MIYLDNASTTQPDSQILTIFNDTQTNAFYNSESLHVGGLHVSQLLQSCRYYIQKYFHTDKEVIFSHSGSHANDIAIRSYLEHTTKTQILVSPYEHPSIAAALAPYEDVFNIVTLPLTADGAINVSATQHLLTDDVALIIMQHVNSETGYILPVSEIATLAHQFAIPVHVDGVQAITKVPNLTLDVITSYVGSGHKFHSTKGAGFLLIDHSYIQPLNSHYLHESATQNGTIDTPSIVAMTKALSMDTHSDYLSQIKSFALQQAIASGFTPIEYDQTAPHILALLSPQFEGQYVMQYLASKNICVSTGTACGHGMLLSHGLQVKIKTIPNHVHDQYLRLSFSKYTTQQDIATCFQHLHTLIQGDESYGYT